MRFRKLRIAWSLLCAIAIALLVVVWVRDYSHSANYPKKMGDGRVLQIISSMGSTNVVLWPAVSKNGWRRAPTMMLQIPNVVMAIALLTASIAPWIHWSKRFTLRTLLIATTLIAVVLGLIVWLAK